MKTILRMIQFLMVGTCLAGKLVMNIILKLYAVVIIFSLFVLVFLSLLGADGWRLFRSFMAMGIQAFLVTVLLEFASGWIARIFGILLNERQEDAEIYENYQKRFRRYERREYSSQRNEYSGYGRAGNSSGYNRQENYNNNSGYGKYENYTGASDNVIRKYEEYLKYFGIDRGVKITSEIIKKAYKTKIKEVHPDRNPGKDTTAETAKVNEIKEFLDMNLEYYLMKRGF